MFIEIGLGFSVLLNLVFLGFIYYLYSKKSQKVETYDVKQLLHDLTRGSALIKIERVDTSDILLRR